VTAIVRPAVPDDAPALAELRWEFRAGRGAPLEARDAFVSRCVSWMRRQLATCESWRAWVAEAGDRIVGQVWIHTIPKLPNPTGERERHAYLSNLYVTPDARGGLGAKLLDCAVEWCEAAEVDSILLQPTPLSRALYMRHGFTERVGFLELKLARRAT
jgi:GNAT superfamily N-acetyltransferase